MITAAVALAAALAIAALAGAVMTRRRGVLAATTADPVVDPTALGLSADGPTVVHFSAPWCGPCAGVRRVVEQVCAELDGVAHTEIDIDADPAAARALSVLSLPTTFIFDAAGRQRYRSTGVPSAADLRAALTALLA
ncbi:thiol reductase thioredoxin [Mycolicibacillus koreensis]|nr:thiol reductase thioredoxin [Mycolicibacillus koreensis]